MIEFQGVPVAPGIGIGSLLVLPYRNKSIPEYSIEVEEIPAERERFAVAIKRVEQNLLLLRREMDISEPSSRPDFISAHLLILKDPMLHDYVSKGLASELCNLEALLFRFALKMAESFRQQTNPMFQERGSDIQDVIHRIIETLQGTAVKSEALKTIHEPTVLMAHDLYPSDTVNLNRKYVMGVCTEMGGSTSHTAILTRSYGIPSVTGCKNILRTLGNLTLPADCQVIVDGDQGLVYVDPDQETLSRYKVLEEHEHLRQTAGKKKLCGRQSTADGRSVEFYSNVESLPELENEMVRNSSGVGLFRSEFLFMESIPSEETQFEHYKSILQAVKPDYPVTIRTLDWGGDKVPAIGLLDEKNPLLGCRAIRLSVSQKEELFLPQLRALYRASVYGRLQIMLPLISGQIELLHLKELIYEVRDELRAEGYQIADVPLGIMIELPSAALTSDILAREADFFSIGTNDLTQYTLGIDRNNDKVFHLYDSLNIGVLKLIRIAIENAQAAGIPVSMCGEMAGDPCATALLVGLGLRQFSMSAPSLLTISELVEKISYRDCRELAETYLLALDSRKAKEILLAWHNERDLHPNFRFQSGYESLEKK